MEHFGDRLIYLHEPILLGDIATMRKVRDLVDDDLVVMNGDTITDINLWKLTEDSYREQASISSFDGFTYTGTTFFHKKYPNKIVIKEYGCRWVDIGTQEALEKARKTWK